jgi:hypothetical protein
MKRILKISAVFILYLLLCGKSCDDEEGKLLRQEKQVESARDSIREEFEVDYLSEESRFAAEVSALQKLRDLSDFAGIFSDLSMDSQFRQKSGEMMKELFVSDKSALTFGGKGNRANVTLRDFLNQGFGKGVIKAEVIFDSIRVLEPIQKSGNDMYKGRIGAAQRVICITAEDTIASPLEEITVDIINQRENKAFGKDTLKVWKVTLGDMSKKR